MIFWENLGILLIMEPERYSLPNAARKLGLSPWTLRKQARNGKIPCIKASTGRRYIPAYWVREQLGQELPTTDVRCVIYARESSAENKTALESQVSGLTRFAAAKGYRVTTVVREMASGMNDARKKLAALLKRRDFDVLLVEHKDRLTRFGFRWFEVLSPFRIEVINEAGDEKADLMEDLVAILTSFSARLYGQRRGRAKTDAAIRALGESTS